jgi:Low psii accumulation1 / Rep27
MIEQNPKKRGDKRFTPEQYARLKAEAAAPYKGLRKFIYIAFGASGLIGAVIFLAQLAAGRDVGSTLPNFALQVGVVALMIFLFRLEQRRSKL